MDLVFRDIKVDIGKNPVLNGISGVAEHGDMLAVMGPSGAGKSTLLNGLACRIPLSGGEVTLNGQQITKRLRRKICYVLQQDIFFASLTLKETFYYNAMLRLPEKMPRKQKLDRIEEIIDVLDLRKCVDTPIGGMFTPGLSGGEKKRASIGCELITNPNLILLDEPTSGLDSAIAYNLMQTLKSYTASQNKTVVVTIHQPSVQMFHMFDRLLLLSNGKVAYFGRRDKIMEFFSSSGLHCPLHYNPADFILDKIKESKETEEKLIENFIVTKSKYVSQEMYKVLRRNSSNPLLSTADLESIRILAASDDIKSIENMENGTINKGFDDSVVQETEIKVVPNGNGMSHLPNGNGNSVSKIQNGNGVYEKNGVDCIGYQKKDPDTFHSKKDISMKDIDSYYNYKSKWPTGFFTQYKYLIARTTKTSFSRIISKLNIIQTLFLSVYCGIVWFQTKRTEETLNDIVGLVFFSCVYWGFQPMIDAILSFPEERPIVNKERTAGSYRLSSYYLSKMTSELPLVCLLPTTYLIIAYWAAGLVARPEPFFGMYFYMLFNSVAAQSIGMFIGIAILDIKTSLAVASTVMLASMLVGGFYVRNIPFWLSWIQFLSFITYSVEGSINLQFEYGDPFECLPTNLTRFSECTVNGTTHIPGEVYLKYDSLGLPHWANFVALLSYIFVFRLLGYIFMRFVHKPTG